MEFNNSKCHILRKAKPSYHNYILHDKSLESLDSAKYLGVTLTSDLRWNSYIANITHKGNRTLGLLRRNLRVDSPSIKSMAYKSLVHPVLEYFSAAWDHYTKDNTYKVEMVQRRAARKETMVLGVNKKKPI